MPRDPAHTLSVATGRLMWTLAIIVGIAAGVFRCATAGLNQDGRFVLGALRTTSAAGIPFTDAWAHRPILMRAIMAVLDVQNETAIRVLLSLLALVAAGAMANGLRRYIGGGAATLMGFCIAVALVLAPGWDFAEPEWWAVMLSVAGVGVVLHGKDRWSLTLAVAGSVLLAAAVLVKYTTVPTVVTALIVIALVDRAQALRATVSTLIATPFGLGVGLLASEHEWQWLRDMPALNPPFSVSIIPQTIEGLTNLAIIAPITLAIPVAAVLLARADQKPVSVIWPLGLTLLLMVPYVVQHQGFLYHFAAIPVLGAGMACWAGIRSLRAWQVVPAPLIGTLVIGSLVAVLAFALGPRQRGELWPWFTVGLGILALAGALWAWFAPKRFGYPAHRTMPVTSPAVLMMAVCLPLCVTLSPKQAYSFSMAHSRVTVASDDGGRIPAPIGDLTDVVYLSFNLPYRMGLPTPCNYASPTFLQRATGERSDRIEATASFSESLNCLSNPRARFLIIEGDWFTIAQANPQVTTRINDNFSCSQPLASAPGVIVCPRRVR